MALFLSVRDGDRSALDELVGELTPLVWQVARSQGLDRDSAAEVVQETWTALLRSIHTIRQPEALVAWLVTATRREAWRVRAKQRVEEPTDLRDWHQVPGSDIEPDRKLLDDERRAALWAAIAQLSTRCQQLLRIIAFVDRPDYEAVSRALKMPRGSIGPTRGRCLAKLRELLDRDWRGGGS